MCSLEAPRPLSGGAWAAPPRSILKAIAPGNGIFEEGNVRWKECQNEEDNTDYAYQEKSCPGMQAAGVLLLEKQIFQPERGPRGNKKDGNVEPVRGFAQNTGIGVVDHRNQDQPQQDAHQLYTPELTAVLSRKAAFDEREQKHGVIYQFHMLPDRFVHCRKERGYHALIR